MARHGGFWLMASSSLFFGVMSILPAAAQVKSALPEDSNRLTAMKQMTIEHGTITLIERDTAANWVAPDKHEYKNLPPRTIVKMVLNPAKGSNIHVELWLPDQGKWNEKFLGLGNGGAAGHINPAGFVWPLIEGYAVATTDMGTAPNADSGIGNEEVWRDFGFRATHLMTASARQIVTSFYGKAPKYSYFNGGSTGGQQAMQEAQRYPDDYDGIVANIPAHCRTPLHAYFLWNYQILTRCPFTDSQQQHIIDAGNAYMASREIPVTAGKIISDPRCTMQDIEAVIALAMKKDPSLTQAHAEALRKLFDGPRSSDTGERIFNGIPFGTLLKSATGHLYLFKWVFGADRDLMSINFGKDIDTYTAALGPYLNAENPDLSAFEKRGGKLIMMSGTADAIVPYHATMDYYERVIAHFGSLEKVRSFYRFYMIPGMGHGGGPGVNHLPSALKLVEQWREKGVAPDVLEGDHVADGKKIWGMPIYPYPVKTGWDEKKSCCVPVEGSRGGVERIAERYRPAASE